MLQSAGNRLLGIFELVLIGTSFRFTNADDFALIAVLDDGVIYAGSMGRNLSDLVPLSLEGVVRPVAVDYDPVGGMVYWTDLQTVPSATISRAHLDGSNQAIIVDNVTQPDGLALDVVSRVLYWTDVANGIIGRAPMDGNGSTEIIVGNIDKPRAIVTDLGRGHIYWTDWGENPRIERADFDGSNRVTLVHSELYWPNGIFVDFDENYLYWCDAKLDKIERSDLSGNNRTLIYAHRYPREFHPFDLAVYGEHVYWTDWAFNSVRRAQLNGQGIQTFGPGPLAFEKPGGLHIQMGLCWEEVVEDEAVGYLTWPVTVPGSQAVSSEICPITSQNAGLPIAVRNCSHADAPIFFEWGEYKILGCGESVELDEITLEYLAKIMVTPDNVAEVAMLAASLTSMQPGVDEEPQNDLGVISEVLEGIVGAGSADPEVTNSVLETVNNVIVSSQTGNDSQRFDPNSSSSIIESVEAQVALTLRREGQVSIREESVQVEAVSVDAVRAADGLGFASVQRQQTTPGQGLASDGLLRETDIQTFVNGSEESSNETVLASIQLPEDFTEFLRSTDGDSSEKLRATFITYADDTLFQSTRIRERQGANDSRLVVGGPVVSLSLDGFALENLTEPVVIKFRVRDYGKGTNLSKTRCAFWDTGLERGAGDWSEKGCGLADITDSIECHCSHLTNFAILVDVQGQFPDRDLDPRAKKALDIISQIGCALSIFFLSITLIIYISIRKIRKGLSRRIFIHFCVSLLMLYIVFLAGIDNAKGSDVGCVFVAALLHYLTLTTMMWMAVEARNMYVSTVKVFPEDAPRYMIKACLAAWGSPLLVLAITVPVATSYYNHKNYCFLAPGLPMYLGLLLPIGLVLMHNVITFILVMRSLLRVKEASRSQQISKRLQNAVGISTLMGLAWIFGFLAIDFATFTFQLIFCLANSFQGVFVFLLFCVRREEVRAAVAPCLGRLLGKCACLKPLAGVRSATSEAELTAPSSPTTKSTSGPVASVSSVDSELFNPTYENITIK